MCPENYRAPSARVGEYYIAIAMAIYRIKLDNSMSHDDAMAMLVRGVDDACGLGALHVTYRGDE